MDKSRLFFISIFKHSEVCIFISFSEIEIFVCKLLIFFKFNHLKPNEIFNKLAFNILLCSKSIQLIEACKIEISWLDVFIVESVDELIDVAGGDVCGVHYREDHREWMSTDQQKSRDLLEISSVVLLLVFEGDSWLRQRFAYLLVRFERSDNI